MRKILKFVFSKKFMAVVLALFQMTLFAVLVTKLYTFGSAIYLFMTVFSIAVMLYLFEKDNLNPSYKLLWVVVMVLLPVTGALFYFLWGDTKLTKKQQLNINKIRDNAWKYHDERPDVLEELAQKDLGLAKQARFLDEYAKATPYKNTSAKYYPMGEDFFVDYVEDLKKAEKNIFMHYFIVDEGYMWDTILEILKEKAAKGVDVRIIYDDFGTLITLPSGYDRTLRSFGIKVGVFNPVKFSMHIGDYLMLNHRDHRKITVIDNNIGYGGGLNIADEYINAITRFGVWKDTAFRIEGEAVYGLTSTFIRAWHLVSGEALNYANYKPSVKKETDGIIQPYFDTPLDKLNICESAYLGVINNAKKYVYITTPYLVIDNEMITSLCLAAQSGIDIKIMVPGIPDKWYVYYITQSYYKVLLEAGVEIYEYTPGFLHAKMYVSDDVQAIVGSANMDFRSMYLHFENCCSFYGGSVVQSVRDDFNETLKVCHKVTLDEVRRTPLWKRIFQIIFRIWSPMM
ncbi:MAG: cardiolipin synthase [Oscillospiraceae bacterium]|nr:cardiolipin synthase [Oscillospiraceae bacterium]